MTHLRLYIIAMGVAETFGRALIVLCWVYLILCAILADWSAMWAAAFPMLGSGALVVAAQRLEAWALSLEREDEAQLRSRRR